MALDTAHICDVRFLRVFKLLFLEIKIKMNMQLQKKRIRNVEQYVKHIPQGNKIIIGISNPQRFPTILERIGFSKEYQSGETVLPPGDFGTVSIYNSEGKEFPRKDLPLETAYRQAEWQWTEWRGKYHTQRMSKIVDIPYKRYPREFIAPPSIELATHIDQNEGLLVVSPEISNISGNYELLKHTVNLFLEIFGECEFFTDNLEKIRANNTVHLNWEILPKGKMPWEQFKKTIEPLLKEAPKGNRPVLEYRLGIINKMEPDFRAVGRGGFHGYIIHGFTDKKLFILESMYYGNATYVFDDAWEELSKKTKAEILTEKLQKDRIVHLQGWEQKIIKLTEQVRG